MHKILKFILLTVIIFSLPSVLLAENVVMVIIDGARYSETFGDPGRMYVPNMTELAQQGTFIDEFYNDGITYTSRAVPALWTGAWTEVRDTTRNGYSTQYTLSPSIFEYYRQQTGAPAEDCFYVLKYITSLWLPSYHPEYGPDYWPTFHSEGATDIDVLDEALDVMEQHHPRFMLVYLADVDHAGHLGDWNNYVNSIQIADGIVGDLWDALQADPFYADSTTLMVTNDHGRHDDDNGGFQGHGCGCEGCRHIMMMAVGPHIRQNYISYVERNTPDWGVTALDILGLDAPYATGQPMTEIYEIDVVDQGSQNELPVEITLGQNYPNPFNPNTSIPFDLSTQTFVNLAVYNIQGQKITDIINGNLLPGKYNVRFNAEFLPSGLYLYKINAGNMSYTRKMVLTK